MTKPAIRRAVPVNEVLSIGAQVAAGLEAAHESGIVHRDLKPSNIRVRDDGLVKVLDLGLAKADESGPHVAARSSGVEIATVTSPAITEVGVILGTASYMAPEQARGRLVDKRADIWADGAVLFEVLMEIGSLPPRTPSLRPSRPSSRTISGSIDYPLMPRARCDR